MTRAPVHPHLPPARSLLAPLGVIAGAAAGTVLLAFVDPNEPGHYPTCPFLSLTGYYCPGCGGMRLVNALAHGHPATAFGFNPLLFLLLPVFGYMWVRWAVQSARGLPMRTVLFRPKVVYAFLGLLFVYWIVRNLPFAHVLAP